MTCLAAVLPSAPKLGVNRETLMHSDLQACFCADAISSEVVFVFCLVKLYVMFCVVSILVHVCASVCVCVCVCVCAV